MWLPNFISDRVKNIASFKTIWNDSIVSGRSRLTKQIRFKAYLKRSETNWNDFTTIQNEFVRNWNDLKRIETILKRFWNESKLFWNELKQFWNDLKRIETILKRFETNQNYFETILKRFKTILKRIKTIWKLFWNHFGWNRNEKSIRCKFELWRWSGLKRSKIS